MGKKFLLCEKPSQAVDFVKALSLKKGENFKNNDGYYESSNYIICFARGHLIIPLMPEDYNEKYKKWNMEDLPIIPNPVEYKVNKDTEKLYSVINKQINRKDVDTIIVATDAEREGELIARLIINYSNVNTSNKKMYRFWTSAALTPDEIENGLNNLKPLKEYDRYYRAALARQNADYIVGLNATRAATIKGQGMISLGRVQTPVLNIVYMRNNEITNFIPEIYFEISGLFYDKQNNEYIGRLVNNENKNISFKTKDEAYKFISSISNIKTGNILSIIKTLENQKSPKLYSISTLQKDASSKAGISANNVLIILQKLYDEKYTTYPRTDSEVLSSSNVDLAKNVMNKLTKSSYSSFASKCEVKADNKNVFDDSKLTDHHALIPTGTIPSGLSKDEQFIYDLICRRFLAVFSPDFVYEQTKMITLVGDAKFYSQGKVVKDMGWKILYNDKDNNLILPHLNEKDIVNIKEIKMEEKHTTAPSQYTDGSLIDSMSKAAAFVQDETLKKVLKNAKGIGTPATKANIIETIISRGYIARKGKQLLITPSGQKLIETIKGEQILDPAYTAIWEQELEKIASGEVSDISNFMLNIQNYAKALVDSIACKDLTGISNQKTEKNSSVKEIGICPECNGSVVAYNKGKGYSCSNKECDFVLWKNKLAYLGKKEILIKDAKNILQAYQDKTTATIDGLISKSSGKEYTGNVILEKDDKYGWGLKLVFDKK